jgi:hypothetical protein
MASGGKSTAAAAVTRTPEGAAAINERVLYLRHLAGLYFTLTKDIAALQDAIDEAHDRLGRAKLVTDAFSSAALGKDEHRCVVASDGYSYDAAALQHLFDQGTAAAASPTTATQEGLAAGDSTAAAPSPPTGQSESTAVVDGSAAPVASVPLMSQMTGEPIVAGVAYPNHNLVALMQHLRAVMYGEPLPAQPLLPLQQSTGETDDAAAAEGVSGATAV